MLRTIVCVTVLLISSVTACPATPSGDQQRVIAHQEGLVPDTSIEAPFFELDFPGLSIGIAEYEEGPTGTTVFRFDKPAMAAVDVRGGNAWPLSHGRAGRGAVHHAGLVHRRPQVLGARWSPALRPFRQSEAYRNRVRSSGMLNFWREFE